jgi:hypothetical protein
MIARNMRSIFINEVRAPAFPPSHRHFGFQGALTREGSAPWMSFTESGREGAAVHRGAPSGFVLLYLRIPVFAFAFDPPKHACSQ